MLSMNCNWKGNLDRFVMDRPRFEGSLDKYDTDKPAKPIKKKPLRLRFKTKINKSCLEWVVKAKKANEYIGVRKTELNSERVGNPNGLKSVSKT